jgi:hypothetical protein
MIELLVSLANNAVLGIAAHIAFGGTLGAYIRILKGL